MYSGGRSETKLGFFIQICAEEIDKNLNTFKILGVLSSSCLGRSHERTFKTEAAGIRP